MTANHAFCPKIDVPALDELELLAQLRAQANQLLAGARAPNGAWLLANYLDLAEGFPAERRKSTYRQARHWLAHWAAQSANTPELERLAARSWALRQLNEKRLKDAEVDIERLVKAAVAQHKRPFVNAREEMAFIERTVQAHLRKGARSANERKADFADAVKPELRYGS